VSSEVTAECAAPEYPKGFTMAPTDAQRAYEQTKERIITTQMPPGAVIQIDELMAELCLGRTPIREALKLLEAQKLVVVSPRRGMFVADVTLTDLLQIHEIRMELEALCACLAVERITESQLEEMRQQVREVDDCEARCDQATLLLLDRRFHALIGEAAHNRLLQAESEKLYNLSLRIWYLCVNQLVPSDLAEDAFGEILAAIETKDVTRANRAMRRHILHFYESIKQYL
jgi:DNA-binding GntR family transcriptional regulator